MNDTPIHEPAGIFGYDLGAPAQLPVPQPTLFRYSLAEWEANARRAEAERCETEARIVQETEAALAEWRAFREQHADNPVIAAALDIHVPEAGYNAVICTECLEPEYDGTTPVEWACGTYAAMRRAM